jgi:hypothetical protein
MPFHDLNFRLDPFRPVQNWIDHLMADPSENPLKIPTLEEVGRTIQAFVASTVLAFDPFTPGSPFCPGQCDLPAEWDYPGLVKMIGDVWPGNAIIDEWVDGYENGTVNGPTEEQIQRAIDILQQDFWSFGNEDPPASWSPGFNLSTLAPAFHKLWTDLGFDPPPLAPTAPEDESGGAEARTSNRDNAILALGKVADPKVSTDENTTFSLDTELNPAAPKPTDASTTPAQSDPLNSLNDAIGNAVGGLQDSLSGGEADSDSTGNSGTPKSESGKSKGHEREDRASAGRGSAASTEKAGTEKADTEKASTDNSGSEKSSAGTSEKSGSEKSSSEKGSASKGSASKSGAASEK